MNVQSQVDLRQYSTMRLGGHAAYLAEVKDRAELAEALDWAKKQQVPVMMIGGGSNIIWRDEGYSGLVLVNRMMRYEDYNEDGVNHYITIGAGENWDKVVKRTAETGLTGIEALSLIPGTAGATPVQNVGAYGQEIADTLVTVEAYDMQQHTFVTIAGPDCGFGYRTSRFKTTDKSRFYITAITLHLLRANPQPPFYAGLQKYFEDHEITEFTPQTVRKAVIDIRSHKLPDPASVANNGSFFANPIVDEGTVAQLIADFGDVPHWQLSGGLSKLSAAWLVERAGFKNFHDPATGMATWEPQPLVFVNEHAKSTADLITFRDRIMTAVQNKFHVTLQQEPEILP